MEYTIWYCQAILLPSYGTAVDVIFLLLGTDATLYDWLGYKSCYCWAILLAGHMVLLLLMSFVLLLGTDAIQFGWYCQAIVLHHIELLLLMPFVSLLDTAATFHDLFNHVTAKQ